MRGAGGRKTAGERGEARPRLREGPVKGPMLSRETGQAHVRASGVCGAALVGLRGWGGKSEVRVVWRKSPLMQVKWLH